MPQSLAKRASKQEEYAKKQIADRFVNILTNTPKREPIRGQVEGLTKKQKSELGKFTLEDFELMREKPRVKNMMARVLEMDVKKLTNVVTVAKGYKRQVDSSSSATNKEKRLAKSLSFKDVVPTFLTARPATARPASERPAKPVKSTRPAKLTRPARPKTLIDMLSRDLMLKIKEDLKSSLEYKLQDWIPADKLDTYALSKNYNAIHYLKKKRFLINYQGLSANTNPEAIELLRAQIALDPNRIDWEELSKNPIAMELLKEQILKEKTPGVTKRIIWVAFCCNPHPETIDELKEKIIEDAYHIDRYIHWSSLSSNISDEAIDFLKENRGNIDWKILSGNTNLKAIELLKEKIRANLRYDLDWFAICRNENAMDIIIEALYGKQARPWDIMWATLARNTNPKAIKIIEWGLIYETDKIMWYELSRNPSAIAILLANKEKIMWSTFSGNTNITKPDAIDLLKDKIEEDKVRGKVPGGNNLSWPNLSANPSIFVLS